jgi:hypothetical protein
MSEMAYRTAGRGIKRCPFNCKTMSLFVVDSQATDSEIRIGAILSHSSRFSLAIWPTMTARALLIESIIRTTS